MVNPSELQHGYRKVQLTLCSNGKQSGDSEVSDSAIRVFGHFLIQMAHLLPASTSVEKDERTAGVLRRRSLRLQLNQERARNNNCAVPPAPTEFPPQRVVLGHKNVKASEPFVVWSKPRVRMPHSGGKSIRRRSLPVQVPGEEERDPRRMDHMRIRLDAERRSKHNQDRPGAVPWKGKGKARQQTPPLRKRKVVKIEDSSSSAHEAAEVDDHWSAGDGMPEEVVDDHYSDETESPSEQVVPRRPKREKIMKKPVTLDLNGLPWGNMKDCLADDVKKYAKSLDPTCNWESQPAAERSQLFKRLYKDWDMLGQSFKLSEKWMGPIVTKILITTRWRLNTLIDAGQPRPADVTEEQWNTLVSRRKTEDSQIMSDHMRSISQGKGSKTAQLKAIERDSIVKLTLQHNRKPLQTEITDEVTREFTRQQTEKRKVALQKGTDMEEVRNRVLDIEGSVTRLEDKMGESHRQMEDMLKVLLNSQGPLLHTLPESSIQGARSREVPYSAGTGLQGTMASLPSEAAFVLVAEAAAEKGTNQPSDKVGDSRVREGGSGDEQVEDFLRGLLQEPDDVVAGEEGVNSIGTRLMNSASDLPPNQGAVQAEVDLGVTGAQPGEGCCGVDTVHVGEEHMPPDSVLQTRRIILKSAATKNGSSITTTKPAKLVAAKPGVVSKQPLVPIKMARKGEGSRKK